MSNREKLQMLCSFYPMDWLEHVTSKWENYSLQLKEVIMFKMISECLHRFSLLFSIVIFLLSYTPQKVRFLYILEGQLK